MDTTQANEAALEAQGRSLWSVGALAKDCDVSTRTVWRMIAAKELEAVKIGRSVRVTEASRVRWLASLQQTQPA